MRRKEADWDYLQQLISWKKPDNYLPRLSAPLMIRWPEKEQELIAAINKITSALPLEYSALFRISLLASALLSENNARKQTIAAWLTSAGGKDILEPLSLFDALNSNWRTVPVVIVQDRVASIVHFLVGAVAGFTKNALLPSWADQVFHSTAREAIEDAITAAKNETGRADSLFVFPLLYSAAIRDRSLGLPLALGAMAALAKEALASHWLATGDVGKKGIVMPVSFLDCKSDCAAKEGFSLFLHPHDEAKPRIRQIDGLNTQPMSNIAQAWRWATLYKQGRIPDLNRLDVALQDPEKPEDFLAMLPLLDPVLVDWCRQHEKVAAPILQKILENEQLLTALVSVLDMSLQNREYDRSIAVARLLENDFAVRTAARTSPTQTFLWCSHNLTLANHFGDIEEANRWATRAESYVKAAHANVPDKVYSFRNRKLVLIRHNRYHFSTKLPKTFMREHESAEKYWQPGTVNYAVGSFYGTMTQNFAYCGSRFLKKAKASAQKAQAAFGNGAPGIEARFNRGYRQQFSYLFYACLDAGQFKEAEENFLASLGISRWEDLKGKILKGSWAQYGLARFLADLPLIHDVRISKNQRDGFISILINCVKSAIALPSEHPWQLWAYNVGRLAARQGSMDEAKHAWRLSLSCCRNIAGATVQVMKLLPLALLHSTSGITQKERTEAEQTIALIHDSRFLNKKHFEELLNAPSPDQALALMAKQPDKYFPFNHR